MTARLDRLKGSIPPLVTPFRNGEVDYDAYARLVALQIQNGSHGILVNGTTAEPSTLSVEERNRLVDIAVETAAGARSNRRRDGLAVARERRASSPSTQRRRAPTRSSSSRLTTSARRSAA